MKKIFYLLLSMILSACTNANSEDKGKIYWWFDVKMTLEEKAEQLIIQRLLGHYWTNEGCKKGYEELKNGQVGSMLNVILLSNSYTSKIAVEETKLGIINFWTWCYSWI